MRTTVKDSARMPLLLPFLALALTACGDPTSTPTPDPELSAAAGPSLSWNATARDLITSRAVASPTTQIRILTYLSVAQYNAIVAAEDAKQGSGPAASAAAAAAGASLVVLKSFFPLDSALLDEKLRAQKASTPWPEGTRDLSAGEAIGRATGAAVLAEAATDKTDLTTRPANPGGPGTWTGVNSLRGFIGARTFALTSGDEFRPAAPPAFGSATFNAALAEIRALSDSLTPAQLTIAQDWAPRTGAYMNGVAAGMIVDDHRSDRDAARILALANMAAFDVANACFDAKLAYYFIRPSQADSLIKLPIGLPNHPSYPSGHSCFTASYATVLASEFPTQSARLTAMVEEAGLSRMYAGLHYRFDCAAGQALGRQVAENVLRVMGTSRSAIRLR
ncbi:phosphoesterase PA-phosphatase related protein [Gemmatirosa kalamazoonensis]|uniref:Phosphoesterase PA-phosphatase related protein n=1 Tax=Gemmatirosa kalamazoonensis TaxID=861299 RepID=W0RE17_9BACT|nr:vanadium-dependent haloperoxidase [Gemmatirosa kalamazoonensis]AHG88570.1 phosphoesterase PA-phosphatase related protein [Gemmatirosa kalamazoonensis]